MMKLLEVFKNNLFETTCPRCGDPDAYVGLNDVDCPNMSCPTNARKRKNLSMKWDVEMNEVIFHLLYSISSEQPGTPDQIFASDLSNELWPDPDDFSSFPKRMLTKEEIEFVLDHAAHERNMLTAQHRAKFDNVISKLKIYAVTMGERK